MNVHEPWWSYWLDEGRRYRLLDPPRVSGYLDGWLVVAVLDKIQTSVKMATFPGEPVCSLARRILLRE